MVSGRDMHNVTKHRALLFDREGQITCICYSLIGIPIFLLCLTSISSILGDIFRFMYSALLHCLCFACRTYARHGRGKKKKARSQRSSVTENHDYVGSASVDPNWPEAHDERLSDDEDNHEEEVDDEFDDVWNRMESRVPIGIVLLIIIGYICLGAFMFNRFEEWTMTQSVYFCFIALSTIGFGDYVS
jgi:hypothetical protein